jgi:hypothetical protein
MTQIPRNFAAAIRGFFRGFRSGYRNGRSVRLFKETSQQVNVSAWQKLMGFTNTLDSIVMGILTFLFTVVFVGILIYGLVAFIKWCWQNS